VVMAGNAEHEMAHRSSLLSLTRPVLSR
jgi:hypothetical protein